MNSVAKIQQNAAAVWQEQNPVVAARGIDEAVWNALKTSVFPGAKDDSVLMAWDYCKARGLDVLLKPVHLVPMNVRDAQSGSYVWRDVPMPGVGMYRIQADRSGNYAGADAPEFGPDVEGEFTDKNGKTVWVTYPAWCKYTVYKLIGDRIVPFTAEERWLENYATDSNKSTAPNAMWQKRPYGQLAKCAEAQALRRGWPEIGQDPTAEEMEGKAYAQNERVINPEDDPRTEAAGSFYPEADFERNLPKWGEAIMAGKADAAFIATKAETKGRFTQKQIDALKAVEERAAASANQEEQ